ncbi:peptidoglycan-binding protein [Lysobacter sp. FW306-1B-D06B]|uniref:CsgG/HfaB family protein n=1 Tax=Lysobacter sp. FW306-1B-D06B TaxID=3140250 RepID=UPI0031405695
MGHSSKQVVAALAGIAIALATSPALARPKSSQAIRADEIAELPTCGTKLGSISVLEPEDAIDWWTGQQLPAPSKLIKAFVSRSGCFVLIDRGVGLNAAMIERELSYGSELRSQSNIGKGQMTAADYVLVPDLVARNANAGGGSLVAGILGAMIGGDLGAVVAGLDFRKKTADVVLTITDLRSAEQVAVAEGSAKKTDLSLAGETLWGGSKPGRVALSGYANTEIGQVIALAYLQAYSKLVEEMRGLSGNQAASNAQRAVSVTKPARLFSTAAGASVVRSLDVGMILYPTGNKEGVMWEVEDEFGNEGWVSSTLLELSKGHSGL